MGGGASVLASRLQCAKYDGGSSSGASSHYYIALHFGSAVLPHRRAPRQRRTHRIQKPSHQNHFATSSGCSRSLMRRSSRGRSSGLVKKSSACMDAVRLVTSLERAL